MHEQQAPTLTIEGNKFPDGQESANAAPPSAHVVVGASEGASEDIKQSSRPVPSDGGGTITTQTPHGIRKRKRATRLESGAYQTRVAHPVRQGARVKLRALSLDALRAKVAWYRRLREDVAVGLRTPEQATLLLTERTRGARVTLVELVEDFAKARAGTSTGTLVGYALRKRIGPWFEATPLARVDAHTLDRYLAKSRERGYEWSTLRTDIAYMRSALRFAIEEHRISQDSAARVLAYKAEERGDVGPQEPKRPRPKARSLLELLPLVEAAARRDVDAAKRGKVPDLRHRILWLAFTMLRKSEAVATTWGDISGEADGVYLHVWRQRPGTGDARKRKAGGAYRLRLHPFAAWVVERRRCVDVSADGWDQNSPALMEQPLWPRPDGSVRKGGEIVTRGMVKRLAMEAGMRDAERWSTHCLRHSGAAMERHYGAGRDDVRDRGGWRSSRMAGHYAEGGAPLSAIPVPQALASESTENHADHFWRALETMELEVQAAIDAYRASGGTPENRAQGIARATHRRDGRRRLRELPTWAALAREAVGDDPETEIKPASDIAREARARARRIGHAAYVAARRAGASPQDASAARAKADQLARYEWTRALGMARRRLLEKE